MIRKLFLRLVLIVAVAGLVVAGLAYTQYRSFLDSPLAIAEPGYTVIMPRGSNLNHLAAKLAQDGILDEPLLLRVYGRISGKAGRIQAGEYFFATGTTPVQLIDKMVAGEVVQHSLTIIEGWTFKQMMAAVRVHPALEQTLASASEKEIMTALGAPDLHPEGQFYPDTYRFPRGTTDLAFLKRAHEALKSRLAAEWESRMDGLPLKSPYEALILASIIERETGVPAERPMIAGVFVRRLNKGMLLQTDPTVIYGMGDAFDGNIRRADLRRDTPYNTYTRRGLPPTPIAMPSGASINAALNPAPGKELYFVSRGDGSHHFSETYAEHKAAVRKYQLKGR